MNSGDDAPMSEINVTPLVDVMLVLLIVFMITMPVLTHSIPLELPTASEQGGEKREAADRPAAADDRCRRFLLFRYGIGFQS